MPEFLVKELETLSKRSPHQIMVFMLTLLMVLSLILLIPTVGVFGQAANHVDVSFGTIYTFVASGDNFTNTEVQGNKGWFSNFVNSSDSSAEQAINVVLTLISDNTFDLIGPPPGLTGSRPKLELSGPPIYRWLAGNVPQYESLASGPQVPMNVTKNVSPINFTPGFDISRSVDRTVFTSPGVQTLTVTLTPKQDIYYFEITTNLYSGDAVKSRIVSPTTDEPSGVYVSPDGSRLFIHNNQQVMAGTPQTFVIKVEVTPLTSEVDYLPAIRVATSEGIANGTVTGSSVTRAIADLGTWTWSAEGNYEWSWSEVLMKAVVFSGHMAPAVAPAPTVTQAVSPSPSSDNATTADALQTPEQKTIEQTGSASILGLFITIVFLLTSTFFNSSLKYKHAIVQGWVQPIILKSKLNKIPLAKPENEEHIHVFHLRDYIEFVLLLIINALITTFSKQPSNMSTFISAFIPSLFNAAIITTGYSGAQVLLSNQKYKVPAGIRMHYIAILIAIMFVVFTRVVRYPPILIYGFVGGYFALSLNRRMNTNQRSKAILLSVAVILIFSIVSFYARGPIHKGAITFWGSVLDNTLAKIVCGGLIGLLLSLLPFDFMDGAKVRAWNFWIWLLSFYVVAFAFAYYVVIKDNNLVTALKSKQTIGVYFFMGIWILIGLGNWLFFRLRSRRAKTIAS